MPLYDFRNPEGEVVEKLLSVAEMEQFVKDNPDWTKLITGAPGLMRENMFKGLKSKDQKWSEKLERISKKYGTDLTQNH